MKFLYIICREKETAAGSKEKIVHEAPIEHPIVNWLLKNDDEEGAICRAGGIVFSKAQVEIFYELLTLAHKEKIEDSPRPWKYLPIPEEKNYPFAISQYEKEYAALYYNSLYKYITVLGVILAIFDFEKNELIVCIR